jgi:hypothetical protein
MRRTDQRAICLINRWCEPLASNDREQFTVRQHFHRDVAVLDCLWGPSVQPVRDLLDSLQVALLRFLGQLVGNDPQTTATAAQQCYFECIGKRLCRFRLPIGLPMYSAFEASSKSMTRNYGATHLGSRPALADLVGYPGW